ncbi:MAG TPA: NFACT RNA binding domain-containing protein [bacterium]|nr:NFACT RNA binding domain-containing protein [bacterium]
MGEQTEAHFDSLALAAVAREIQACRRARFAGVRQPSRDALVVSLRTGGAVRHLLCSIHPKLARIHFVSPPEETERLTPFGLLLRSRLVEARLEDVEQPPFDRIIRLAFDALEGRVWLIAEIMGRHSNVVLADDRVVIGALKVVTAQMSRRRPVLPGRPYVRPPADRPTPDAITPAALAAVLTGDLPLARRISQAVLGVSPTLAREVAVRAGLDPQMPAHAALGAADLMLGVLREIAGDVARGAFAPVLYAEDDRVVAFAPFPLRVYERLVPIPVGTMSEALDRYYRDAGDRGSRATLLDERRAALRRQVAGALDKRGRALQESREILAASREAERYRVMGELLLTYAHGAKPGAVRLRVPDHTAGGAEIEIPLDPALTPSQNAQRYFRRYAKGRAAVRAVPARIAALEDEVRALRDALVQIDAAASPDDLWEIHTDLAASRLVGRSPRGRPAARTGPRRFATPDGAVILVGRSARENDRITFRESGPDDLWFHARGIAGAHVILKAGGRPSEASIRAAAEAAAYYSEGRAGGQVAVDCVARRHVRKPRGAAPGAVTYTGERTLRVTPQLPPPGPTSGRRSGTAS